MMLFVETMLFEKHVAPAATQPLRLKSWSIRNYETTAVFLKGMKTQVTTRLVEVGCLETSTV